MAWKIAKDKQELLRLYDGKAVLSIHEEDTHFWVEVKENGKVGVEKVLKPLSMDKVKQVLLSANFPPVIVKRLEETRENEIIKIVRKALNNGRGVILCGPTGVGKTHAMVFVVANALRYYKVSNPVYISTPELDIKLVRELYKDADLLVLDDLNFMLREWMQDFVRELIYHCYNHEKLLLIATNKTFKALATEVLQEEPIISRLVQMCDIEVVAGEDMRKKNLKILQQRQQGGT